MFLRSILSTTVRVLVKTLCVYSEQVMTECIGNHTAYKQVKGTKTSPDQILDLYDGLQQSNLNHFDVLLTGYMPSAACVQAIGKIGRDIKLNAGTKPGSFFWGESARSHDLMESPALVLVRDRTANDALSVVEVPRRRH